MGSLEVAGEALPSGLARALLRWKDMSQHMLCPEAFAVGAIVSTYKSARFLAGCLEDLIGQTLYSKGQLQIIVIDSASPENEQEIVQRYAARHPHICYQRTEQRETIYAAWNRGVNASRSRYLTNANTDDRHRADALERMAAALDATPDAALVYADVAVTDGENRTFETAPISSCFRWPDFDASLLFDRCYVGPQPLWRRSLHDRYGLFDARFVSAGDYEFWLRIAPTERFLHVDEALGVYLSSPESVEHRNQGLSLVESELARLRYWPAQWGKRVPRCVASYRVPVAARADLDRRAPAADRPSTRTEHAARGSTLELAPADRRGSTLQTALARLSAGDAATAVAILKELVNAELERGRTPEAAPWASFLLALLCAGAGAAAAQQLACSLVLRDADVDRVRWLLQALTGTAAPVRPDREVRVLQGWMTGIEQLLCRCGQHALAASVRALRDGATISRDGPATHLPLFNNHSLQARSDP